MDPKDVKLLPRHLAIIMDGNGRWAKKRGLPRFMGHREGAKRVYEVVQSCYGLGIPNLTLYAFSTENWKRPQSEITQLFKLLGRSIEKYREELVENEIQLVVAGDLSPLAPELRQPLKELMEQTANFQKMTLTVCLNYGGQQEILRGALALAEDIKAGAVRPEDVTTESFNDYLYTKGQPPVDLMIRPSGELRVSNFLLYQLAYSEFWFSDTLWPDFKEPVLLEALEDFSKRNRRFGGLK
ncbi:MAG: polyprenyl diphosphate synthase [Tissierellia bacterium]|nr:polyprenyl diphosphate synthase [Tissierellia bacterium]